MKIILLATFLSAGHSPAQLQPFTVSPPQICGTENRIAFAGYFYSCSTGLYFANARWYDPEVARFTTQDSVLGNVDNPPSLHRYTYSYNNPTGFIDPSGHESYRQWMGLDRPTPDFWHEASVNAAYRAFNIVSLGTLGRQDALVEQFERGRITDEQYGTRTTINAGASVAIVGAAAATGGLAAGATGTFAAMGGLTAAEATTAATVAAGGFGALGGQTASDLVEIHGTQTKGAGQVKTSDYVKAFGLGAVSAPLAAKIGNPNLPSMGALDNPVTSGALSVIDATGQYAYRAGASTARAMVVVEGGSQTAMVPAAGGLEPLPPRPGNSPNYSVVIEAKLKPGTYTFSDKNHFRQGNSQLHDLFDADPDLAARMELEFPGIIKHVTPGPRGGMADTSPPGTTWHHEPAREGVLQLVPTDQHAAAGAVQDSLHPNGAGGRANWGGGTDARR